MIFLQGSVIYGQLLSGPNYWQLKMVEPLLFCAPACLLMAATGYRVAIRCMSRTVGGALLVGCVVGAVWALVVIIAGNTIAQLNGAMPLTLDRVIRMMTVIPGILIPLAVLPCIFTRWRGTRLGFVKSPVNTAG